MKKDKKENSKLIEIKKENQKKDGNHINRTFNLGVTFLYFDDSKLKRGVLISVVVKLSKYNFQKIVTEKVLELRSYFNYEYLGVHDVFAINRDYNQYEILGRNTLYKIDTKEKALKLTRNSLGQGEPNKEKLYGFSLVYFVTDKKKSYVVVGYTIVKGRLKNLSKKIMKLGKNKNFYKKLNYLSVEKFKQIEFIGVEDYWPVNSTINEIQTLYSNNERIENLKSLVMKKNELQEKLDEIFELYNS